MSSGVTAMPVLEDRVNDFGYGYRMKCKCGGVSDISAADYYANKSDALMPCNHCDGTIHYGPAVAALRDDDAALDNERINTLAWYHTGTSPNWPTMVDSDVRRAELTAAARSLHMPADQIERWIDGELNKALHVGTYEAAIENMLPRIRDQCDEPTVFYLHRVALMVGPARLNDGYRNEDHEPAAELTTIDLRAEGLDAVRYLNVNEAVGSISLAVLPETIAWVQTISLAVASLSPGTPRVPGHDAGPGTGSACRPTRHRTRHVGDNAAPTPADPDGLGARPGRHRRRERGALEQSRRAAEQGHHRPRRGVS
jgi:hypothetical protein